MSWTEKLPLQSGGRKKSHTLSSSQVRPSSNSNSIFAIIFGNTRNVRKKNVAEMGFSSQYVGRLSSLMQCAKSACRLGLGKYLNFLIPANREEE